MTAPLTTKIPIFQNGRRIGEKEVATYAGVLARAHEEGLKRIETELIQAPADDNGFLAIARATVETDRGVFSGIGDAAPHNVNSKIAPHIVRMAETRAKGRALRDAINVGIICLEELGADDEFGEPDPVPNVRPLREPAPRTRQETRAPAPRRSTAPAASSGHAPRHSAGSSDQMTEKQLRLLLRILSEHGHEGDAATDLICETLGVQNLNQVSKRAASQLIDRWKDPRRTSRRAG